MEKIITKVKKWGNSFGVILPKEVVKRERLQEDQEIRLDILSNRRTTVKDIFGKLKFKGSTQKILDEIDRDFEPETFT